MKKKENTYSLVCKKKTYNKKLKEQHQLTKQQHKDQYAPFVLLEDQLF